MAGSSHFWNDGEFIGAFWALFGDEKASVPAGPNLEKDCKIRLQFHMKTD
jgi:hypothetical protein